MPADIPRKRIALIGGGPSALFVYKKLLESGNKEIEIYIFERKDQLGIGMPYSQEGANKEHITNVSGNELPSFETSLVDWVHTLPPSTLKEFGIEIENFNGYKVLPRLLFGQYLTAQFELLRQKARQEGLKTKVYLDCVVSDIIDNPGQKQVTVETQRQEVFTFDHVVICTGHNWPMKQEGSVPGYYDSPYPPSKLGLQLNHPVAIKGSSLTAIDAIRTLARHNGAFKTEQDGRSTYQVAGHSPYFKLVMHSKNGMLPAIRFHLEDSDLSDYEPLQQNEIEQIKQANGGFLPLDFVFKRDFKERFKENDPAFYARIKDVRMEDFVESMMTERERMDPFQLFKAEYVQAEKSIREKESIHWKELLAVLSFAMNHPAKHFSAEDMLRLQKVLMPLISIVIAFVPQSSARELLALHDAGILELVSVDADSTIDAKKEGGIVYHYKDETDQQQEKHFHTFVDCVGQPHLSYHEFPFPSLVASKSISPARLQYKSKEMGEKAKEIGELEIETDSNGHYYLQVPGITIDDHFRIVDQYGTCNNRIFIMAVPYIGGYNPDYSGLDFCEATSERIVKLITDLEKETKRKSQEWKA